MQGNERYVSGNLVTRDLSSAKRTELAGGQHPFAVVLTCSDSRVAPELLFDQSMGDIFVIRVAGVTAVRIGPNQLVQQFPGPGEITAVRGMNIRQFENEEAFVVLRPFACDGSADV